MKSVALAACVVALVAGPGGLTAGAQDAEAARILERYDSGRPKEPELSLFRLDWVRSLREAKEKAARENRPILLLTVQNEHGGLYSGHC